MQQTLKKIIIDSNTWTKETLLYALIDEAKKLSNDLNSNDFINIEEALKDDYIEECNGVTLGVDFKEWPVVEYSCYDEYYGEGFFSKILGMGDKYKVEYNKEFTKFLSNHLHKELNEFIGKKRKTPKTPKTLKRTKRSMSMEPTSTTKSFIDYNPKKNYNQCDSMIFLVSAGFLMFSITYGVLYST